MLSVKLSPIVMANVHSRTFNGSIVNASLRCRKIVVVEETDYGGDLYGRFRERLPEFVKETRGRMATCLFSKKDDINRSVNERKLKDAQTLSSKRKGIHLRY